MPHRWSKRAGMKNWKNILLSFFYIVLVLAFSELLYIITYDLDHISVLQPILNAQAYGDADLTILQQLKHRIIEQPFNFFSLIIFLCAICHIFLCHKFVVIADRIRARNIRLKKEHPESFIVEFLKFMGEVEVVFGIWVIPLMIAMSYFYGWSTAIRYLNGVNYTEPLFVLVIMTLASTKPITNLAENLVHSVAQFGGDSVRAWWLAILTFTPLLGSFITEPAAMTIAAILLGRQFYKFKPSKMLSYATLGLLFTNISVGGVLTNFAAPPVLLVVQAWDWTTPHMMFHFGTRAICGIFIANLCYYFYFRKEFSQLDLLHKQELKEANLESSKRDQSVPFGISLIHVLILAWIVVHLHFPVMFIGTFLLFLGFYKATQPYQDPIELKTPILVAFFLAGLIVHGNLQGWWVSPLLQNTTAGALLVLSMTLSAFNDNAGVTFLATLIPDFSDAMKYSVVAGAVTGGGLTVIANAPSLAGQSILNRFFNHGISALWLFFGALPATIRLATIFYLTH